MTIISTLIFIAIILVAITVHEFAHAWTADVMGDPTPRFAGRLTLNPIKHIDPIGFIMLLLVRFGWAKPVPINPYNFKNPARGEMIVSLAGPLSNFLLAFLAARLLRFLPYQISMNAVFQSIATDFILINIGLAVFNLLPIPPLDGSHILDKFLPEDIKQMFEQYGFLILLFIFIYPPISQFIFKIMIFIFRAIV